VVPDAFVRALDGFELVLGAVTRDLAIFGRRNLRL
jgi:hypothetical protein